MPTDNVKLFEQWEGMTEPRFMANLAFHTDGDILDISPVELADKTWSIIGQQLDFLVQEHWKSEGEKATAHYFDGYEAALDQVKRTLQQRHRRAGFADRGLILELIAEVEKLFPQRAEEAKPEEKKTEPIGNGDLGPVHMVISLSKLQGEEG